MCQKAWAIAVVQLYVNEYNRRTVSHILAKNVWFWFNLQTS
jgi:hypothetical protein